MEPKRKRDRSGVRKRAIAEGAVRYFTGTPCVRGHVADRQTSNGMCVECGKVRAAESIDARRDAVRRSTERNKEKNKAARKQAFADYKKRHRAKVNAWNMKRVADKAKRTPGWLTEEDFWLLEQAYDLARLRTELSGFVWHVDHVLPLRGRFVSGLHVPTNVQVIPGVENLRKHNRYEVAL